MKSRFIPLALVMTLTAEGCAPIGFSVTTPSGDKPTYARPNPEESDGELTPVGYALLGVGLTSIALALLLSGGKNPEKTAAAFDQAAKESKQNEICFVENGCQGGSTAAVGESGTDSNGQGAETTLDESGVDEGSGSDTSASRVRGVGPRRARGSKGSQSADGTEASAAGATEGEENRSASTSGEAGATPAGAGADASEESGGSGWQGGSWCAWLRTQQPAPMYSESHCAPEHYYVWNHLGGPQNNPLCVAPDCAALAAARYDELTAVCRANVEKNKNDLFSSCELKAEAVANDLAKSCRTPCPKTTPSGAGRAK